MLVNQRTFVSVLSLVHVPTEQLVESEESPLDLTDSVNARLADECGYSSVGDPYTPARTSVALLGTVMRHFALAAKEIVEIADEGLLTLAQMEDGGFSVLHDVCDANTLGGMCDDGFRESFDAVELPNLGNDRWMEFCNLLSDLLDAWMRAGGVAELAGRAA